MMASDHEYSDAELAKAQPDASQLKSQNHLTPISQWPDEDFDEIFDCENAADSK
jgi:hypothetical protein